jgi:hypothetical protein
METKKPEVIEVFADNGEHSHWVLIDPQEGTKLWSENPSECEAMGYPVQKNAFTIQSNIYLLESLKTIPRELRDFKINQKIEQLKTSLIKQQL